MRALQRRFYDMGINSHAIIRQAGESTESVSFCYFQAESESVIIKFFLRAYEKIAVNLGLIKLSIIQRKMFMIAKEKISNETKGIVVSTPEPDLIHLARYIKKRYPKINLIVDIRDGIYYESLSKNNPFLRFLNSRIEKIVCKEADAIVTVNPELSDFYQKKTRSPVIMIANGFAREWNIPLPTPSSQCIRILYAGRISKSRKNLLLSLSTLEDALMKAKRVSLRFVGDFDFMEKERLSKIGEVKDSVPHEELYEHYAWADYLLLFTGDETSVTTLKFFDYLATGRKIIHIGNGSFVKRILEKEKLGWTVGINEKMCLEKLFVHLSSKRCVEVNSYEDVAKYNLDKIMSQYIRMLKKLD